MSAEARLEQLGLVLPSVPSPVANYVPFRLAGNLLFLSGQGPRDDKGHALTGKVGDLREGLASGLANLTSPFQSALLRRTRRHGSTCAPTGMNMSATLQRPCCQAPPPWQRQRLLRFPRRESRWARQAVR